jgi:putative transposase
MLFGDSVAERAQEVGVSERTLYRRVARFQAEGMESLFDTQTAKRRELPPAIRRLIVDLKAEYSAFNLNEMANIVYVRFGRRPDYRTVGRVLREEPWPLKMWRRFDPYHRVEEPRERRTAIVRLHAEGWTVKAIAGYLKIKRDTVYETLRRFIEEGEAGLEDKKRGRPKGVSKVDLKAIDTVRRLQKNPNLGEFRIHAALAQIGIHLSPRTCGRILALNRRLYGYEKPIGPGGGEKEPMPFACSRRHEYWSADVRYVDHRLPSTTSTSSPSWRTTAAPCWPARSPALRTPAPSSRCSTGRSRGTARRRFSSPTAVPSSAPTGRRPSTKR